jgi:hypothetical protein
MFGTASSALIFTNSRVEGDEQFHSRDSNEYGPIAINLIESKLTKIIWPPSRIGDIPIGGRDPRITKRKMNVDGNASDWEERNVPA